MKRAKGAAAAATAAAEASFADHHSDATILSGTLRGDETITTRKVTHLKIQPTAESQMDSLF